MSTIGHQSRTFEERRLRRLFVGVRDTFLELVGHNGDEEVPKVMLELIELRAANWQLSSEAILYFYR